MAKQNLSAELTIDAFLGSRFKKSFAELDNRVEKSTRKMRNIGKGVNPFTNVDRMVDRMTQRINKFASNDWGSAVRKMTSNFSSGFRKVSSAVTNDLKRKFSDASKSSAAKWKKDFSGIGTNLSRRGPPLPVPVPTGQLVKSGFSDIGSGFAAAGLLALGAGYRVKEAFKNTNDQISDTHDNLRALKRQSKNYEDLAKHAREMDKAVSPWLRKIDRVNQKIEEQEKKLDRLRMARERYNRTQRAWSGFREKIAPMGRRAGYAALGMGIAGGYATVRGAQQYANFDQALRVLQAEGVSEKEIPVIREQIFKLAETTQFTDTEIANILVGMKKDGQEIDAQLTGVPDILKLAVAESKDLMTAWEATRTIINSTQTDLAGALRLQEQLSNATSLSSLQLEDLQYIAGQSLAIYQGIDAFQSADFLAFAGQLGPLLRKERIATGLREFALTMSSAAAGNLAKPRQDAFNMLGINIADEQGRLKDAVSILKEFERAFKAPQFLDKEGKQIGDKIQTTLAEIFGREAAPSIVGLIGKSEQIAENIERINTAGTIDKKFSTMDKSLTSAANKFQSAVSVASKRFFLALDGDGNFAKIIDGMTAAVQWFSNSIEVNKKSISEAFTFFMTTSRKVKVVFVRSIVAMIKYLQPRLPAIKQFFINFWKDIAKSWAIVRPLVMGVIGVLGRLLDILGRFAGGNTGMLSWIFLSIVGWKALKLPILAVTAAFNGVAGIVLQLKSHFGSLRDLISSAIGKAREFAETMTSTPHIPTSPSPAIPLPGPTAPTPPATIPPVLAPALPIPTRRSIPKPDLDDIIDVEFEVLPNPKSKTLTAPTKTKALPAPKTTALDTTKKAGKLQKVKSLFPKLPKAGIFAKIGSWLLKIGNIAKWIMIPISALIAKLSFLAPIVTAVGSAIAAIGSAIAAIGIGPVVAVVAAVVAIWTAAISIILKNWEKVKGAVIAVWGTVKTFGSFIWEVFKFTVYGIFDLFSWLGNAIWKIISPVATVTGKVFKDVGIGIGNFFKSVFGSIWTFAKAVWNFVSSLFGTLFGWIEAIAKKFTGWFESWKSFFKKRNDEREVENLTKVHIKETIETASIDDLLEANLRLERNQNMSYIEDRPVEINQTENLITDNIRKNIPYKDAEFDVLLKEKIEKAPLEDLLKNNEQIINRTPLMSSIEDSPNFEIEKVADTPDFSKLATDAMSAAQTDFDATIQTPDVTQQVAQNYDTTSVEYVDFSSVDEIDKTLKSGFTSLETINSQIITELQQMRGVEVKSPKIQTPETGINIQTPGVDIEKPTPPKIKTPEVNVDTPPVPRPAFPAVEKEKEKTIREILIEKPPPSEMEAPKITVPDLPELEAPEFTIPGVPPIESPILAAPDIQQLDSPVISPPTIAPIQVQSIQNPLLETQTIDAPVLSAPEIPQLDNPVLSAPEIQPLDSHVISAPTIDPIPVQSIANPQLEYDPLLAPEFTMPGVPPIDSPVLSAPDIQQLNSPVISPPTIDPIPVQSIANPQLEYDPLVSPEFTMPGVPPIDSPVLSAPDIPQMDSPVLAAPEISPIPVQSVANPQLEHDPIEVATSEPPVHRVEISPIRVEASQNSESGDTVEITNNFNIYQQPGEDADVVAQKVAKIWKKDRRTGAYDY